MANQGHLDVLKQGVEIWNQWRKNYPEIQPDLSETNLSFADLSYTNFSNANIRSANLSNACLDAANLHYASFEGANFSYASLIGTDLSGNTFKGALLNSTCRLTKMAEVSSVNKMSNIFASYMAHPNNANFHGADLTGASLKNADLSDADLSDTDLREADFSGAYLRGANLRGANLCETIFAENDLTMVKGLVEIAHYGPSHVVVHTVKLPQDGSALHFLRGTGVPDEWIDLCRARMISPVQYHSCFISYASQDDLLAHRLHADLQDRGVRCWFAPENMKIGDKIRPRINEAIHLQDKLLLLLSEHALTSAWVEDEVEAAFEKEQHQQREVLFPVRLDESVMQTTQAWAAKLRRTRHIGNFTRWTEPQAYQSAFERLLRDLKRKNGEKGETNGKPEAS